MMLTSRDPSQQRNIKSCTIYIFNHVAIDASYTFIKEELEEICNANLFSYNLWSNEGEVFNRTWKYTDTSLKFGFTFKDTDGIAFPMFVICFTALSNESMKTSKLSRQLETTDSHLKDKPVEYFQTCIKSLQGQQTLMKKTAKVSELALK